MTTKSFDDLTAPLYATAEGRRRMDELRHEYEAEVFAYKIGELRQELGIDQKELADRLGMSQAGVSKLEQSADPKLSTLVKLTSALGATLHLEVACEDHTVSLAPYISLQKRLKSILLMPIPPNEESAKLKIVVPILQNLGWNPYGKEVLYEHSIGTTGGGRVDVALRASGRTVALIEVKAPKPNLDIFANQVFGYASHAEVDICVLTNGLEWLLYLPSEEMTPESSKFAVLKIKDSPIEEILEKLYTFLSREQLISGQAKRQAQQILESSENIASSNVVADSHGHKQTSLSVHNPKRKSTRGLKTIILFGERYTVKTNRDILMKVVEELYIKYPDKFDDLLELKEDDLPLVSPDAAGWTLYRTNSKKSSIRELEVQGKRSGYCVFVGNSTHANIRKRANLFLERFGHKPSDLTILSN